MFQFRTNLEASITDIGLYKLMCQEKSMNLTCKAIAFVNKTVSLAYRQPSEPIKEISHLLLILNHTIKKLGQWTSMQRYFLDEVNRCLPLAHLRKQYIKHNWQQVVKKKKKSVFSSEIHNYHTIVRHNIKISTSPKSCSSAAGLSSPSLCATWSGSLRAFGTENNQRGWRAQH